MYALHGDTQPGPDLGGEETTVYNPLAKITR